MEEELDNFIHRIDEINSILKDLKTLDPDISTAAAKKADAMLQNKEKNFEEDGLKIKTNKTVINKRAFEYDPGQSETTSPEAFMAFVEKDAEKRAADRRERKAIADEYKKKGNDAFRAQEYEKAYDFYSKAIEKIKDSCLLYTNRALTCLHLELYNRVISDCEWAHKLNEKSLKAWLYKARAYYNLGESDKAAECIMAAEQHNPGSKSYIKEYVSLWDKSTQEEKE